MTDQTNKVPFGDVIAGRGEPREDLITLRQLHESIEQWCEDNPSFWEGFLYTKAHDAACVALPNCICPADDMFVIMTNPFGAPRGVHEYFPVESLDMMCSNLVDMTCASEYADLREVPLGTDDELTILRKNLIAAAWKLSGRKYEIAKEAWDAKQAQA